MHTLMRNCFTHGIRILPYATHSGRVFYLHHYDAMLGSCAWMSQCSFHSRCWKKDTHHSESWLIHVHSNIARCNTHAVQCCTVHALFSKPALMLITILNSQHPPCLWCLSCDVQRLAFCAVLLMRFVLFDQEQFIPRYIKRIFPVNVHGYRINRNEKWCDRYICLSVSILKNYWLNIAILLFAQVSWYILLRCWRSCQSMICPEGLYRRYCDAHWGISGHNFLQFIDILVMDSSIWICWWAVPCCRAIFWAAMVTKCYKSGGI